MPEVTLSSNMRKSSNVRMSTSERIAAYEAELAEQQQASPAEIEVNQAVEDLRQQAHTRRWDLEQRRQRLSLDAISDAAAQTELEEVEADLAKIEVELQRLGLAAAEHERREIARLDEAEYQRRRSSLVEASELTETRLKAARKVDKGAAMFFDGLAEYAATCQNMARLLRDGGAEQGAMYAGPNGFMVWAALAKARYDRYDDLRSVDLDRMGYIPAHQCEPLGEVEERVCASIDAGVYVERIDADRAAANSAEAA